MDVSTSDLLYRFGVAVVIGLLIGLQREYAFWRRKHRPDDELFAGARTFPLIALLGSAGAFAAEALGSSMGFIGALLVLGGLLVVAHYRRSAEADTGLTTEVAAVLTLFMGALCFWDRLELAAALGVTVAVLLALKVQTHALARTIDREDVYATLKFAVITAVVLPLLPEEGYGPPPFNVLVPYNVWLMVVLISGISFFGYVLIKVVGPRRGVGLTGILGGIASSTAVTLSFAQRSHDAKPLARPFALAIVLAWTIMFVRVLVEVAVLNRALLMAVWKPIGAALLVGAGYCLYLYWSEDLEKQDEPDAFKNPFELGPALTFGALYAVILVGASAAESYFGTAGVYVSSFASGLADVDAITLSMAELSRNGSVDVPVAARAVVLAAVANTLVKGGIVLATGAHALRPHILPGMLLMMGTALTVVFLL
jgi:uncharacterized membrane protein (DUF4010 family)